MGNHMVPGKGMVVQGIGLLDMAFEEGVLFDCTAFLLPIELTGMEQHIFRILYTTMGPISLLVFCPIIQYSDINSTGDI